MKINISEFIESKELRTELAGKKFKLFDTNGQISGLDFVNGSMRKNHIETFNLLYKLGGDKLFETLIAEGKTCLADDPQAVKVGITPIEGTDRFFLKANASATNALSSILFGLYGWAEMSGEEIYVISDEQNVDFIDVFEDEEETIDWDSILVKEEETEMNKYKLLHEIGAGFIFSNETTGQTVDRINVEFEEILLKDAKDVSQVMDANDDTKLRCYKYRLEENGLWGFISGDLEYATKPVFENIITTYENRILAWCKSESCDLRVHYSNKFSDDQWPVISEEPEYNCFYIYTLKDDLMPEENSVIEEVLADDGTELKIYFPNYCYQNAIVAKKSEEFDFDDFYDVSVRNNIIIGSGTKRGVVGAYITAGACIKLYSGPAPEYNVVERLYIDDDFSWYLIQKDAYYGVGIYTDEGKLIRIAVPLAFTGISKLYNSDRDYSCGFVVEQFGKKGVFFRDTEKYIIPCEYEDIKWIRESGIFIVKKMNFEGKIEYQGYGNAEPKWIVHLHRVGEDK